MRRVNQTPRLINAKFASTCSCGQQIKKGDECLYFPSAKKVECRQCATPTLAALADEEMPNCSL